MLATVAKVAARTITVDIIMDVPLPGFAERLIAVKIVFAKSHEKFGIPFAFCAIYLLGWIMMEASTNK